MTPAEPLPRMVEPAVEPAVDTDDREADDPWAFRIATLFGIPLRVHVTFLLLLIYFAIQSFGRGGGAGAMLSLLGLFASVVLHELGHSRVAQKYHYPVHNITLYPIGGVASIEGSPRPRHELLIAVAGPLVSLTLALLLGAAVVLSGGINQLTVLFNSPAYASQYMAHSPLLSLWYANVMLVLFNLLPAFPMDGGRVLRALLGFRLGKRKATRIAAFIGQGLAILMGATGLGAFHTRPSYGLVFIAVFVFFGAAQEMAMEAGPRRKGAGGG